MTLKLLNIKGRERLTAKETTDFQTGFMSLFIIKECDLMQRRILYHILKIEKLYEYQIDKIINEISQKWKQNFIATIGKSFYCKYIKIENIF